MFCNQCGATLPPGAVFCSACGRAIGGAPAGAAAVGRVASNRTLLAALWLAYSLYRLAAALLMVGFDRVFAGAGRYFNYDNPWAIHVPSFVGPLLAYVGVLYLVLAFAGIGVGLGLLQTAPWGRIWAILLGILSLLHPLLGTALGIYTLWVLLPAASDAEYARLARTHAHTVGASL